jgi:hypothetical protein
MRYSKFMIDFTAALQRSVADYAADKLKVDVQFSLSS